MNTQIFKISCFLILLIGCTRKSNTPSVSRDFDASLKDTSGLEVATLAGGCFWKMDACYQQTKGVQKLAVGYAGGTTDNPTYEQVGTQKTGHAETIQLVFDPKIITYREILEIFWNIHDASILNREGNDVGNDYRSAVFFHSDIQRKTAESVRDSLEKLPIFKEGIVTEITPFTNFYKAEDYHQNYYNQHPLEPYCFNVVRTKVSHFEEMFKSKIK